MAVTIDSFRGAFPEFDDAGCFPDAELAFWQGLGLNLINAPRWGNLADYGLQLFMAHNLSLGVSSKDAALAGGSPGAVIGAVTSGSVDKVSYSRDPGAAMDPKNGHWNLTTYGLRYIQLVRMVGAGPVQVGVPLGGYEQAAWPGVTFPPAWQ